MNTDSYFEQGHTHEVCEDYAISGETDNIVYAVIADGCSEADQSDVGARLIAHAFIPSIDSAVRDFTGGLVFEGANARHIVERDVLRRLANVSRELQISTRILRATLVAAVYSKKDSKLRLFMWGDGQILLKYPDRVVMHEGSYLSNAPYYLSYRLQEGDMAGYEKEFGSKKGTYSHKTIQNEHSYDFIIDQEESLFIEIGDIEDLEQVIVTSDGVDSYLTTEGQAVDRAPEFYAFKNCAGDFVQRRMKKLCQQTKQRNETHFDDISVAAISFK